MSYQDPYKNPSLYDSQYWWKKNDLEFWKLLALSYNSNNILEIGSGTGRVGIPLVKEGFNYSGLELSNSFNGVFKKKLDNLGLKAKIYNYNYESFFIKKKFELIISPFNTFNHCLSKRGFNSMLMSVAKHLIEDGRFVFELFVPDPLALYRSKSLKVDLMEYPCPKTGKSIHIKESIIYNHRNNIINVKWYYYKSNNIINKIQFQMKAWYPATIINLIEKSNFIIDKVLGDYDGSSFNAESKKQIYICKYNF